MTSATRGPATPCEDRQLRTGVLTHTRWRKAGGQGTDEKGERVFVGNPAERWGEKRLARRVGDMHHRFNCSPPDVCSMSGVLQLGICLLDLVWLVGWLGCFVWLVLFIFVCLFGGFSVGRCFLCFCVLFLRVLGWVFFFLFGRVFLLLFFGCVCFVFVDFFFLFFLGGGRGGGEGGRVL